MQDARRLASGRSRGRGNFLISARSGSIAGIFNAGANTRLVCASRVLSEDLMRRFSVDDYFVVKRPLQFAHAIAECLDDVLAMHVGDCSYSDNGFETSSQQASLEQPSDFGAFDEQQATTWFEAAQRKLSAGIRSSVRDRGIFTKRERYRDEQEYRFAWTLGSPADGLKLLTCPEAVRYRSRR